MDTCAPTTPKSLESWTVRTTSIAGETDVGVAVGVRVGVGELAGVAVGVDVSQRGQMSSSTGPAVTPGLAKAVNQAGE